MVSLSQAVVNGPCLPQILPTEDSHPYFESGFVKWCFLPSRKLDGEGGRKGGREIAQRLYHSPTPHLNSQFGLRTIVLQTPGSVWRRACWASSLTYLSLICGVTLWGKCAWLPFEINSIEVPQGNSFKDCSGMGSAQVSSFGFLHTLPPSGLLLDSFIFHPTPHFLGMLLGCFWFSNVSNKQCYFCALCQVKSP